MKILVTGATGFIGAGLINELLKTGNSVIATARDPVKAKKCRWFGNAEFIPYDLDERRNGLYDFFSKPDLLIHTAWDRLPVYDNREYSENNFQNSLRFISDMAGSGLKNLVVTGTCFEYGLREGCMNEDDQPVPVTEYAMAKLKLYRSIQALSGDHDFIFKWIRLFYVYGKDDTKNSIIVQLENSLKNNEEYFNMSNGDQVRDFLPVEEVCEYIVKISLQDRINGIINCCSGKPVILKDFIVDYLKNNGKTIRLKTGVYPYNTYEPLKCWGDDGKLKRILGLYL
jgi:nucleoside-diphosphate-sugar epimerase